METEQVTLHVLVWLDGWWDFTVLVKEIALFNISYLCLYLDNCKFKPVYQVDFLLLQRDEEIYKPNAEDFE